ncbi:MAG: hypothetical protein ACT4PL_06950 [Phycisphaerales bacterium]
MLDHFVLVTKITYSSTENGTSPRASGLFAGHARYEHEEHDIPRGTGPHRPIEIVKNVYNLGAIFSYHGGLAMSEFLMAAIAPHCQLGWRELKITRAFYLPYGHLAELVGGESMPDGDGFGKPIHALWDKYKCAAPVGRYFEPSCESGALQRDRWSHMQELSVLYDAPSPSSAWEHEVCVSREMVNACGIVAGAGRILRPDVYEILRPYIHHPWFWVSRYLYEPE